MKKIILSFLAVLAMPLFADAQQLVAVNFETGFNFRFGEMKDFQQIRRGTSVFDDCGNDFDLTGTSSFFLGVKPEIALGDKFSILAGARLTTAHSSLLPFDNYFLWDIRNDGTTADCARINSIRQDNIYVGVPVELRWIIRGIHCISPYIKAGASADFRVYTHNNINFRNKRMERYSDTIDDQIGEPKSVSVPVYGAVGIQCGPNRCISAEFQFPNYTRNAQSSFFDSSAWGFGFQVSYRLPLIKNISQE